MPPPQTFRQPHVALRNLPYDSAEAAFPEAFSLGGVLGSGQVVWTEQAYASRTRPQSTLAFVEGIGMVLVDPYWLTCVSTPKS